MDEQQPAVLILINRFEFKTVMVVDGSFDRLSQNYLKLSRSPSMSNDTWW